MDVFTISGKVLNKQLDRKKNNFVVWVKRQIEMAELKEETDYAVFNPDDKTEMEVFFTREGTHKILCLKHNEDRLKYLAIKRAFNKSNRIY
jgi:hypothetical protein